MSRQTLRKGFAHGFILALLFALGGCGGGSKNLAIGTPQGSLLRSSATGTGGTASGEAMLSSIPSGAEQQNALSTDYAEQSQKASAEKLFEELKELLMLELKRGTSKAPSEENAVENLQAFANGDGSYTLAFSYKHIGDYNRDGVVNIDDLYPLAENFGHKRDAELGWPEPEDAFIDGNNDGVINLLDVYTIADNFFSRIDFYSVYGMSTPETTSPTEIDRIHLWKEDRFARLGELFEKHIGDDISAHPVDALLDANGSGIVEASDLPLFTLGEGYYQIVYPLEPTAFPYIRVVPENEAGEKGVSSPVLELSNYAPIAVLLAEPTSGYAPLLVNFDASQSYDPDGLIVTYEWDFNGDGTYDEVTTSPASSYTYEQARPYLARLRVTDLRGAQATDAVYISVTLVPNEPPVAVIVASTTHGPAPLTVDFSGTLSYDPDGSIKWYQWDFDGEAGELGFTPLSEEPTASYTYFKQGTYDVLLRVYDNKNASAVASKTIIVEPPPNSNPVARLRATPTSGVNPLTVNFVASESYDPNDDPLSFYWDFGDGVEGFGNPSVQHTFYYAGTYRTIVSVLDGRGGIDNASIIITVNPRYLAVMLHPSGATNSVAYGIYGNTQVGVVDSKAALWQGSAESYVDLHPSSYSFSIAVEASEAYQVGWTGQESFPPPTYASRWSGTSSSVATLPLPGGFAFSTARGISPNGEEIVGFAERSSDRAVHALLWSGSPISVLDLHPDGLGYLNSFAYDAFGGIQVGGVSEEGGLVKAAMWTGTPDSFVLMHPQGYASSLIYSVSGSTQVGYGIPQAQFAYRALKWSGTAESAVDITPEGYESAYAMSVSTNETIIVGYGAGTVTNGKVHALVWLITDGVTYDLHQFLPGTYMMSHAYGVSDAGIIAGSAELEDGTSHAFIWVPQT